MKHRLFSYRPKLKRFLVSDEEALNLMIPKTMKVFGTIEELQKEYSITPEHTIMSVHPNGFASYKIRDGHLSPYFYKEEMVNHFKENNSETAYQGPVYSDWIPIDFDKKDDQKGCAELIEPFLTHLLERKIEYILFNSGSKGFHLYIPKGYLKYPIELDNKMNLVSAMFIEQLIVNFPTLDKVVDKGFYTKTHLLRGMFCSHENGKYKRRLVFKGKTSENYKDWFEAPQLTREYAKETIQLFLDGYNIEEPIWTLNTLAITKTNERKESVENEFRVPYLEKFCIYEMMLDKNPSERHNTANRILAWAFEKGLPEKAGFEVLSHWNNQLDKSLPEKEILHAFKYWGKYSYTCTDYIKKKYCNNRCSYFIEHQANAKAYSAGTSVSIYKTSQAENTEFNVSLHEVWEGFNQKWIWKPHRGHIVTAIGASGVGKTIFLLNIMLKFSHINWLFFSYEMCVEEVVERFIYMLGLNTEIPGWEQIYEEKTKHITIIDDNSILLDEHPQYKQAIEASKNIQIHALACDYLGIVPVKDYEKTKILISSTEQVNIIAVKAKAQAKEGKYMYLFAAQPTLGLQAQGNTPLTEDAAKDGQSVQAMSDYIITMWRPYKQTVNKVDDVFTLYGCKSRHAQSTGFINCEWWNERFLLGNELKEKITQREFSLR